MVLSLSAIPAFAAEVTPADVSQSEAAAPVITDNETICVIERIDDELAENEVAPAALDSYFEYTGELAPKASVSGSFKITSLFGEDFSIIAGASNTGGRLTFYFESEILYVPCNGSANVIARYHFPAGTYRFQLYNGTSNTTMAVLNIYKTP